MAGVNVDAGGGSGRRALDSEINMIPMIDLLMVTISFLLITAVWSHMSRMNANAQVPGPPTDTPVTAEPRAKQLHIEVRSDGRFALVWKEGATVVSSTEVARNEVITTGRAVRVVRYPDLAAKVAAEWTSLGGHRDPSDRRFDQAILHTDNETPYASLVGVMDAVEQVHRPLELGKKVESVPAFNLTFAVN